MRDRPCFFDVLFQKHEHRRQHEDRKNAFGLGAFVHSFLKIGDHIIDNTFNLESMKHWNNIPFKMFEGCSASKYNDGDPADPKFGVLPQSSEIGNDQLIISLLISFVH